MTDFPKNNLSSGSDPNQVSHSKMWLSKRRKITILAISGILFLGIGGLFVSRQYLSPSLGRKLDCIEEKQSEKILATASVEYEMSLGCKFVTRNLETEMDKGEASVWLDKKCNELLNSNLEECESSYERTVTTLNEELNDHHLVESFEFVDWQAAYNEFADYYNNDEGILELVSKETIPESFTVTLINSEKPTLDEFKEKLESRPGVRMIETSEARGCRSDPAFLGITIDENLDAAEERGVLEKEAQKIADDPETVRRIVNAVAGNQKCYDEET